MINIQNICYDLMQHEDRANYLLKYNPKVYLNNTYSLAQWWQFDSTTPSLTWPEMICLKPIFSRKLII